ncbi:MAG: TIM barrel protein [Cyclobacteriaceae bacterium]
MDRRKFLRNGSLAAMIAPTVVQQVSASPKQKKFNLKYAPHLGMFKHHAGDDPVDQLNFMADQGFTAFEDNGMKGRSLDTQKAMAATMEKSGIEMGVFVAHTIYWQKASLTTGNQDSRDEFLKEIKESVEVAKRVNAKWMTVVPGHLDLKQDMGYQTSNVVESLKQASAILEPHNLTMVLEPLNFINHPGLFLTKAAQAFSVCKAVDSPSCKILFDIYHQQIQEGNLIRNIENTWDETAYYQIGDNPGRKEPTTGEINYKNVFKTIHSKGFDGILGMEHGNFYKGKEGEQKLLAAYRETDKFI